MESEGVLIGSDSYREWILPWWWKHYSAHSKYPVAIVDFGMSEEAAEWCVSRGMQVEPQSWQDPEINEDLISFERKKAWESYLGASVWSNRVSWFKKPFALQQTPFSKTLWLDTDCQVMGSLKPIFDILTSQIEIAVLKEPPEMQEFLQKLGVLSKGEVSYNSGVVAFRKGAKIIDQWADLVRQQNGQFIGDREALSRAIFLDKPKIAELSSLHNWSGAYGRNKEALVHHFQGRILKMEIVKEIYWDMHFGAKNG